MLKFHYEWKVSCKQIQSKINRDQNATGNAIYLKISQPLPEAGGEGYFCRIYVDFLHLALESQVSSYTSL